MASNFQPLFGHAAEEFQRYRPEYPPELFERLLAAVPPSHRRRALDLGAGTGRATGALLRHFAEVIAVEPDPRMAAKLAGRFPRASIRQVTAEECALPSAGVDLAVIANALHWMEASSVLANVHQWLCDWGILAVIIAPLPKAEEAVDAVIRAELKGPWLPHRDPRLKRERISQDLIRAAPGFRIFDEAAFANVVRTSPAHYTGFWRSTSFGSAYARALDDPERYWRGLESRLASAAGGSISVDFSPGLILAAKAHQTV
jgi:SAM-dependent methyltransferase